MNYKNWQQIHKQAYQVGRQKTVSSHTPEERRLQIWKNLQRWCTEEELQKLSELAERYQSGLVVS
jgi:hypothetical protein